MQASDHLAWQKEFLGREPELAVMLECWRKVAVGGAGPQFVLLLGDSGYGKTRLLHEFYHRISREENGPDGEGYWPDVLTDDFNGMQVNPGVCNPTKEIPWMWWGLRWPQRIGGQAIQRNESVSDGLRSSLSHLEAHAFPLIKKRALRNSAFGFAWSAVQIAASLLPLASFGVLALKWINDAKELAEGTHHGHQLWRHIQERFGSERKEAQSQLAYRPALHEQEQKALSDKAFDFAEAFLDTSRKELPTIPFILVLDDAQEADPTSLDFVEKLYRAATFGNWPLLVIATHWERNWQLQEDQPLRMPLAIEPPDTCFQLVERLFPGQNRLWRDYLERGEPYPHTHFHPLLIGNLSECADILALAYPGLGDAARQHILEAAHGNPKILTDFLQLMARRQQSWWWQDGATDHDLTPMGLEAMRKLPHRHAEILTLLIEDVRLSEPHIIESLSLSSAQGMQFLHELTATVACELGRPPSEQVSPSLQRAAHPHNLVRPVPARAPASEFREAIVCRLLQEAHSDVSPERLHNALRQVLLRWFTDGKFENHLEAGRLYTRLLEFLDQTDARQDPTAARIRLRAVAEYFVWLHGQWEFDAAAMQLARLETLAGALPEWPSLELLPFELQVRVIQYGFLPQQNLTAALRWCDELLKQHPPNATTVEGVHRRNLILSLQAHALIKRDGAKAICEARQAYADVAASYQELRQSFGDSDGTLLTESVSLAQLCEVELAEGDHVGAKKYCSAALQLTQQFRQQCGDSPATLRCEGAILTQLGRVELSQGDRVGAKKHFVASLQLAQQSRQQFGDSPGGLRDESVSLIRLGDLELDEGNLAGCKRYYTEALKLRQQLRQQFGDSPDILRDESVSLMKLGDVELAEGDHVEAKKHYSAALQLSQQLRQQCGESPQTLRDDFVNLMKLGHVQMAEGDRVGAKKHYSVALQLSQQLRQQFGDSPETLHDELVSLMVLGDVELPEGDLGEAKKHYSAALQLSQQSRQQFGDNPETLRDELMNLNGLGNAKLAKGDRVGAKKHCSAALQLSQQFRQQFGDSPDILRDEIRIHASLALAASAGKVWGECFKHIEAELALFRLLFERHGTTLESARECLRLAQGYIKLLEKSGQSEKAKPLREWLDGLKSAQPDGSSSGGV